MPDTALRDLVLKRLDADTQPDDAWSALVLAALDGPSELDKLLEDGSADGERSMPLRIPATDGTQCVRTHASHLGAHELT